MVAPRRLVLCNQGRCVHLEFGNHVSCFFLRLLTASVGPVSSQIQCNVIYVGHVVISVGCVGPKRVLSSIGATVLLSSVRSDLSSKVILDWKDVYEARTFAHMAREITYSWSHGRTTRCVTKLCGCMLSLVDLRSSLWHEPQRSSEPSWQNSAVFDLISCSTGLYKRCNYVLFWLVALQVVFCDICTTARLGLSCVALSCNVKLALTYWMSDHTGWQDARLSFEDDFCHMTCSW